MSRGAGAKTFKTIFFPSKNTLNGDYNNLDKTQNQKKLNIPPSIGQITFLNGTEKYL